MKVIVSEIARFMLLVSVGLAACASDNSSSLNCDAGIEPISQVTPVLPPRLHNAFEGYALVEFEVRTDGRVIRPRIRTAEWTAVGRTHGAPDGYDEAIVAAVSQWIYPPTEQQCRATTRMVIEFEG
jgi:hypothetical protein